MENTPFKERIHEWLRSYDKTLHLNGINTNATNWIAMGVGIATLAAIGIFFIASQFGLDAPILLAFAMYLAIIDLSIGYPLVLDMRRVSLIEEAFPNVLRQLSDTLKAGGTYEYALREISENDYGPLTSELKLVLRRIEEGQSLDTSLRLMADTIDSRLVRRTVSIIVDALRSGGALSEILDEIADDMRAMHRIQLERRSRTTMQALFMVAAGGIIGPAILGFTTTIIEFLISTAAGAQIVDAARIAAAEQTKQFIVFLLTGYIVLEIAATSGLLALMREGSLKKSIIYLPLLLFTALFMFYLSRIGTRLLLSGLT